MTENRILKQRLKNRRDRKIKIRFAQSLNNRCSKECACYLKIVKWVFKWMILRWRYRDFDSRSTAWIKSLIIELQFLEISPFGWSLFFGFNKCNLYFVYFLLDIKMILNSCLFRIFDDKGDFYHCSGSLIAVWLSLYLEGEKILKIKIPFLYSSQKVHWSQQSTKSIHYRLWCWLL